MLQTQTQKQTHTNTKKNKDKDKDKDKHINTKRALLLPLGSDEEAWLDGATLGFQWKRDDKPAFGLKGQQCCVLCGKFSIFTVFNIHNIHNIHSFHSETTVLCALWQVFNIHNIHSETTVFQIALLTYG